MALVGIDWGTTSLRAYLMDESGKVLETLSEPGAGTMATSSGGNDAFAATLHKLLETGESQLWRAKETPVLMCGMVGSRHGWKEVSYVPTPATPKGLAASAAACKLQDGRVGLIVPGVSHGALDGAAPDVMRGEETQLIGVLEAEDIRLVVLPGTHSKWASGSVKGVTSFRTQMTGEVFDLLKSHSTLGKLMTEAKESSEDYWEAFEAGLARSGTSSGLLSLLFSCRTEGLASNFPPEALASYLSGIIIGHELRDAAPSDAGSFRVPTSATVVASDKLCEIYRRAFKFVFGVEVKVVSGRDAVASGFMKIWKEVKKSQEMVKAKDVFFHALKECPLVAILRGIKPDEAVGVGKAMVEAGVRIVEVPLNSPEALKSIKLLAETLPAHVSVGAGTVLTPEQVQAVGDAGGTLIISPNTDEDVIRKSKDLGLVSLPGVATPTEAFAALKWGADGLKAFPGEQIPPKILKAWRAVLPKECCLLAVGGVTPESMDSYWAVGCDGFGIGSNIYSPGDGPEAALEKAKAFVIASKALPTKGDTKRRKLES